MDKVVLVACGGKKRESACKVLDLYMGPYFSKCMQYAQTMDCPVHIISAEHHLLDLDRVIAPYDKTMNKMPRKEQKEWAEQVERELRQRYDVDSTVFVILGGRNYWKDLKALLPHVETPLAGLGGNGKQMRYMKELIESAGKGC